MNVVRAIVTAVLLAFPAPDAAGERVYCYPGKCWFPDHMEMLAFSYDAVDPRVDAVVVVRVEAASPFGERHPEDVGTAELGGFRMDLVVDDSIAGCYLAGDRFSAWWLGFGRAYWQEKSPTEYWRERPPKEMAPVLALADANWNLERELHDRADLGFFHDLPALYERNRGRLFDLASLRDLPLLLLHVSHGDIDGLGRITEVVVVPGQRYLMFVPGRQIYPFWGTPGYHSNLRLDVYPESFAEHLPKSDRPEGCEAGRVADQSP